MCLLMRKLIIEASSLASARGFLDALSGFRAEIVHAGNRFLIRIELADDAEIVAVSNVIENHVSQRGRGAAVLDLDGRPYTLHAAWD